MPVCFLKREKRKECGLGGWGSRKILGRSWGRGECNKNILLNNYFQEKIFKYTLTDCFKILPVNTLLSAMTGSVPLNLILILQTIYHLPVVNQRSVGKPQHIPLLDLGWLESHSCGEMKCCGSRTNVISNSL